jgi:hypothetical protein
MQSYSEHFGRLADFRVRYRWLGQPGQRRPQKLFQHIRSDFCYAEFAENQEFENYFMIHPEFETEAGKPLAEDVDIPPSGTAGMWIIVDEMRDFHRERIRSGVTGFMMAGPDKLAEVEVIEVVSLSNKI